MQFYQISSKQALDQLETTERGLSNKEVKLRQKKHGLNRINVASTPWWKKLLEPFMDVFMLVLAVAAGISYLKGEHLDGTIILVIMAISAGIFYVQRFSTDRVLRSLNKRTVEKVAVLRNGRSIHVPSPELVPGDIVTLTEGEKIPADIRLIRADNLRSDESVLTGESLPVRKTTETIGGEKPVYEQSNLLFSGAFITGGTGTGVVVATGNATQFGNIATLAKRVEAKSPVQKKIDKLITQIAIIVAALAVVTFALALFRGMEWSDSLRFVIALSVSAIPEGLPIAISIILALGMRRMARKKALVQQMRAIETLGVITTIATDKTGTLTQNRLSIQETWQPSSKAKLERAIARSINHGGNLSDPLDKALIEYARKGKDYSEKHLPSGELPFDQAVAMSATVWHNGPRHDIFIKGAPESVMKHSKLTAAAKKKAETALADLAEKGYRVIALATVEANSSPTSFSQILKKKLDLHGFIAVADALRPEAATAIKTATSAGVSVRMITGDHAETAYQIGKQLGMVKSRDEVLDCRQLDQLNDRELVKIVDRTKVFARVIPEQKYRLLSILKKHNITAMTGDGVNDVPALANSHIGVAMGSGSHIAKDAGDIILLDDNFKTIIDAMREGRVIISNVKRMLLYLLATNAGEALTMLGALVIGTRLPLEPVQILWVNLVTDTSMVIPLGLEPAEKDVMKEKPQKPRAPMFTKAMVYRIIITAIAIAALTLAAYLFFAGRYDHEYAQTMAFAALVVCQWGNAFAVRSHTQLTFTRLRVMNRSFYVGLAISIALQLLVFFGPLQGIFYISTVDHWELLAVLGISFILPILASDAFKLATRSHKS